MNAKIKIISALISLMLITTLARAELVFQVNKANSYQVDSLHTIQPNIRLQVGYGEIFDAERYLTISLTTKLHCPTGQPYANQSYGSSQSFLTHVNINSRPITANSAVQCQNQCQIKWFTSIYDRDKPEYLFFIGQPPERFNFGKLSNPQEFVKLTPPLVSNIVLTKEK